MFSFSPSFITDSVERDISEAPIGPRSVVATSADQLEECKWELEADTEKFINAIEVCLLKLNSVEQLLTTAQKIVYNYAWGEYNVLILPPSFPYGGMENPIFTFATPSIISKVFQGAIKGPSSRGRAYITLASRIGRTWM